MATEPEAAAIIITTIIGAVRGRLASTPIFQSSLPKFSDIQFQRAWCALSIPISSNASASCSRHEGSMTPKVRDIFRGDITE
jgi:hypothetical protein